MMTNTPMKGVHKSKLKSTTQKLLKCLKIFSRYNSCRLLPTCGALDNHFCLISLSLMVWSSCFVGRCAPVTLHGRGCTRVHLGSRALGHLTGLTLSHSVIQQEVTDRLLGPCTLLVARNSEIKDTASSGKSSFPKEAWRLVNRWLPYGMTQTWQREESPNTAWEGQRTPPGGGDRSSPVEQPWRHTCIGASLKDE